MSHNPGLSEKAWNELHKLAAKLIQKYGDKILSEKKDKKAV